MLGIVKHAAERRLEARSDQLSEPAIAGLANIMAVQVGELHEVEARGRLSDGVEVEPFDRLFSRDDLGIAMTPAEPQQIIPQGLRQVAHVPIGLDAKGTVAL